MSFPGRRSDACTNTIFCHSQISRPTRILNTLFLVLVAFFFLSCSPQTSDNSPLSIKPAAADFGVIQANDPIAFRDVSLTVKNLTRDTVTISAVELPDGFSSRWIPRNVLPGGTQATLKITMDTRNFTGDIQQVGYLFLDGADPSSVPLPLRASVVGARGAAPPSDAPDISFDQKTVDLGVLRRDQVIEHSFTFKNLGQKPLKILSVKTMCSCLSGRPADIEIPPGATSTIVARMEAFNYDGNRPWKSLFVETNDPDEPITNLTVSAEIVDPFFLDPKTVLLPNIRQGEPASARVKLIQREQTKLLIDEIAASSTLISVQASPLEDELQGYLLNVIVSPQMPSGKFDEVVTIYTSYEGAAQEPESQRSRLLLYVKGEVSGDISVSPRTINFGPSPPGKPLRRKVTLSSATADFQIASVSLKDPAFRATYTPLGGKNRYEVTVEFSPSLPERQIEDALTVRTTLTNVVVPVYAAVQAPQD
jgi:hypothetical protein